MSDSVTRAELREWLGAMVERLGGAPAADPVAAFGRAMEAVLATTPCGNVGSDPCYRDYGAHRMPGMKAAALFCTACRARWHLRSATFELVALAAGGRVEPANVACVKCGVRLQHLRAGYVCEGCRSEKDAP